MTVSDSAGVRVTLTGEDGRVYAEVEPTPVLSLGGADAAGPTQFANIRGVHVDRRGNLWVADGASAEVRLFRPDGSHWKTLGGSGDGPGEFRRIRLLGGFRGDSVAFWDDASGRLTVVAADGDGFRTAPVLAEGDVPLQGVASFPDGAVLAMEVRRLLAGALQPGDLLGDTARLVRVEVGTRTRSEVAWAPGPLWLWTGSGQVPLPFTGNAALAVAGDALHLAAGPEFRIRVFEGGRPTENYGVARPPRAVTREAIDAYRAFFTEAIPDERQRGQVLSGLDHPARPDLLPAWDRVIVGDDGTVWARVYRPDLSAPSDWDVFDADRRWAGRVTTPRGFTAHAVAGGRIVGVWRDELGVEHVRVHRLRPADRTP